MRYRHGSVIQLGRHRLMCGDAGNPEQQGGGNRMRDTYGQSVMRAPRPRYVP